MKVSKKLTVGQRKYNYGHYIENKKLGLFKGTFEQWLKITYDDLINVKLNQNKDE